MLSTTRFQPVSQPAAQQVTRSCLSYEPTVKESMMEKSLTGLTRVLLLVVAIAAAARVIWNLLDPMLPTVLVGLFLVVLIGFVLRGPRSSGRLFHK